MSQQPVAACTHSFVLCNETQMNLASLYDFSCGVCGRSISDDVFPLLCKQCGIVIHRDCRHVIHGSKATKRQESIAHGVSNLESLATDQEQLEKIKSGSFYWNRWRNENPDTPVRLRGVDLAGKDLREINLSNADLQGANLSNAYLQSADLRGADLRGANLNRAILTWAQISGANLQGADTSNSDIEHTWK